MKYILYNNILFYGMKNQSEILNDSHDNDSDDNVPCVDKVSNYKHNEYGASLGENY